MATQQSTCFNCNITGLPLFVGLYTVLPQDLKPSLPPGMSGERVVDVDVSQKPPMPAGLNAVALASAQYGYALTVPRAGYIHVFYETCHRGSRLWDTYTVHGDGCLTLQPSLLQTTAPTDKLACSTSGHIATRTHYIVIEQPESCGTVWIAFTEHRWTAATFDLYATNDGLRARRMQSFNPQDWLSGKAGSSHAVEAAPASLGHVLQYRADAPHRAQATKAGAISTNREGQYSDVQLAMQASRYPFHSRAGQAELLVKQMHVTGKRPDGKSHKPVLLGVWDAVGIVHELHGFRSDAAGRVAQYHEFDRALQVSAMNLIEGARQTIEAAAEQQVKDRAELARQATRAKQYGPGGGAALRKQGAARPEPARSHYMEAADLLEQWEAQDVPSRYIQRLNMILRQSDLAGWNDPKTRPALEKRRNGDLTRLKAEVEAYLQTRDPKQVKEIEEARLQSWPKYEACIVRKPEDGQKRFKSNYCLETFEKHYQRFIDVATALINARTVQLVKWLNAPLLIDTLNDYDKQNLACGVAFEDVVATAIFGIGDCAAGAAKLDEWVRELDPTKDANLFWRAVGLNHSEIAKDLKAGLAAAKVNPGAFNETEFGLLLSNTISAGKGLYKLYTGSTKFYDKKVAELVAEAAKAAAEGKKATADLSSSPLQLRALASMGAGDRLMLTAGDRVFKLFRLEKAGDSLGEKLVQHMFNMRALIHPDESIAFINGEVKERLALQMEAKRLVLEQQRAATKAGADAGRAQGRMSKDTQKGLHDLADWRYDSRLERAEREIFGTESVARMTMKLQAEARADPKSTLNRLWGDFLRTGGEDKVTAYLKDRRIVVIAGLLEVGNLIRLGVWEAGYLGKRDAKTAWSIGASILSITAGVAELSALAIKQIFSDKSYSFNRLKFIGGSLAAGAAAIGVAYDLSDMVKEGDKGRAGFMVLYAVKAGLGTFTGLLGLLAALNSGAILLERIIGKQAAFGLIKKTAGRTAGWLGMRLLGMTFGGWISWTLLGIQFLIVLIDDDELQKCCKRSGFGIDFEIDPFRDAGQQIEAFRLALGIREG